MILDLIDRFLLFLLRKLGLYTYRTLFAATFAILGAVATAVIVAIVVINARPPLNVWHDAVLDEEFTVKSPVTSMADYLALEDRLFAQLKRDVYDKVAPKDRSDFNRYTAGSRSDPGIWPQNWNRTFRLTADAPTFGVLLLHGYSDSPYSLRALGLQMREQGGDVLGLRLPGHGTAPSALKSTTFEDMAAAVRIAMKDMKSRMGDRPIFIIGYSNGATLATHYALASVGNADLPRPAGIVLVSPSIGITRVAAFAGWQAWVGDMLGLDSLAWSSVEPEFDPYKYNSFAVNAGRQAFRATQQTQSQLDALQTQGRLAEVPPILAFQSVVDATVSARAVLDRLFARLPQGHHQLVMFDVNRIYASFDLLKDTIDLEGLLRGAALSYDLAIVTNRDEASWNAVVRDRAAGETVSHATDIGLSWPGDVYSLSHIALPFGSDDPLYGNGVAGENPGIRLGDLAARGERGVLAIPVSALTRQRWNPFFPFLSNRVKAFINARMSKS